jgi:hypothetical protein
MSNKLLVYLTYLNICQSVSKYLAALMLFKIQERALRFIYDDYNSSYENLLEKSKLPSLKIRRLKTIAVETFKIIHKNSPSGYRTIIKI